MLARYVPLKPSPTRPPLPLRWAAAAACALALALPATPAAAQAVWLYGERHDHPDHAAQAARDAAMLARTGRLHAVVVEMAERGHGTDGLPPDADAAAVRRALAWDAAGWPWATYAPLVMAAVQAGVPVRGGNLPRSALRAAMAQPQWDQAVPPPAQALLREAVRAGHCGLLPEAQLQPMVRMQVARDRALAQALADAARDAPPDAVVLLMAGAMHASRAAGVPQHLALLAPALQLRSIGFGSSYGDAAEPGFDEWRPAHHEAVRDECANLRQRGMPTAPADAADAAEAPGAPAAAQGDGGERKPNTSTPTPSQSE